ncbi:MAG TPA: amidohydrolase family protein [Terriglobales bacterium]|nr:amidohydrolase family protein [Terriglobales bacterium]
MHFLKTWFGVRLALVLAMFALCGVGNAQSSDVIAIVGGQLVDGNGGPPVHRSVVLVKGKKIQAVGREGELQIPANAKVVDAHGMTVMPGLIEMHTHLLILGAGDYYQWFPWLERQKRAMEVMKITAHQLLMQGVTTARDVMSPTDESIQLRDAINSGKEVGPRLFVTGAFIARNCWMLSTYYCDKITTPEEGVALTRKRIASGVDWVKAWMGVTAEDLKAITEEAHKAGKKVATHGTNDAEINAAVDAHVDSIEHTGGAASGPFSPQLINKMAQSGIWVVPTMMQGWVYKLTEDFPERVDDPQLKKDFPPDIYKLAHEQTEHPERLQYYFADIHERIKAMPDAWKQLISGISNHILLGTDSGTPLNWQTNATRNELILFVQNGMTPLQAISAGTRWPAMALGKLDEFGTVVPNKYADIIVVDGNPLEDMAYMKNVVHIFKEGVQVK